MSDDIAKAVADALTFGTGATLDGKHVPLHENWGKDDPTAYIVWNEDRTEGVIFVTEQPHSDPNLPSALQDARQASTGERASMFGSTMAEAFYDAFDEDDARPIQAVSYAALLALPTPPDAG